MYDCMNYFNYLTLQVYYFTISRFCSTPHPTGSSPESFLSLDVSATSFYSRSWLWEKKENWETDGRTRRDSQLRSLSRLWPGVLWKRRSSRPSTSPCSAPTPSPSKTESGLRFSCQSVFSVALSNRSGIISTYQWFHRHRPILYKF